MPLFFKTKKYPQKTAKKYETVPSGAEEIKKQETLVRFSTVSYKNRLHVWTLFARKSI